MESDLSRYHHVDLADLYRGELSLRRLSVLIAHLPPDSATVRASGNTPPGWGVGEYLLADLFHTLTGDPHPSRPKPAADAQRHTSLARLLKAQRARQEQRASEDAA